MADRVLFIGWGEVARGCEERALETFHEALGILGRHQEQGRIEGFDVVMLSPNAELDGYMTVRGSVDQINGLQEDDAFQRNILDASLVVDRMRLIEGHTNEGVSRRIEMFQEAMAKVPQRA